MTRTIRKTSPRRVDHEVLDATSEDDIARQARDDDAEAMRDMGRFARRVRRRLGLTQAEFARRIDVPHETIRNWEQGKRGPTGAARALLEILDKVPGRAARARVKRRRAHALRKSSLLPAAMRKGRMS